MKFTDAEMFTIQSALRVAFAQFVKDRELCKKDKMPRLANQFNNQALECFEILDRIDNEE